MKKLLYVAANPDGLPTLKLDAEISAIQERFLVKPDNGLSVIALPDLDAIKLEYLLQQERPDILHIAAHGDNADLRIRTSPAGGWGLLTADALNTWLPDPGPQLVYVNACKSEEFVNHLVELGRVSLAIGADADILNSAARAAAVTFYSRIISGSTVQEAFDACRSMASIQQKSLGMVLKDPRHNAGQVVLRRDPLLVARFADFPVRPRDNGWYAFQLGIFGCRSDTSQVIFFTNEDSYADEPHRLEENMSTLVRQNPTDEGEYWVPIREDLNWYADRVRGDARIFVVGVSPSGNIFSMRATRLSAAVERYYMMTNGGIVPENILRALEDLLPPERADRVLGEGFLRKEASIEERRTSTSQNVGAGGQGIQIRGNQNSACISVHKS